MQRTVRQEEKCKRHSRVVQARSLPTREKPNFTRDQEIGLPRCSLNPSDQTMKAHDEVRKRSYLCYFSHVAIVIIVPRLTRQFSNRGWPSMVPLLLTYSCHPLVNGSTCERLDDAFLLPGAF
jgi:hypothetical protein